MPDDPNGWMSSGGAGSQEYPYLQDQLQPYPGKAPTPLPGGMVFNPHGTIPFPQPKNPSTGFWHSRRGPLAWSAAAAPVAGHAAVRAATWSSPFFDLRPDLRASANHGVRGIQIWRPMGVGGRLWVQLYGLTSGQGTNGLKVVAREYGDIIDPNNMQQILPDEDITGEVASGTPTVALDFLPPGSGYPMRYWRLELAFVTTEANPADLPISVQAAYY